MKIKQQGFTLIELVVVIIILGILAVTAAPKFLNLKGDAHLATLQGVKASLQSANSLVYSKAVIKGVEKQVNGEGGLTTHPTVNTGSENVELAYGYLLATSQNMTDVLDINSNDFTVTVTSPAPTLATLTIKPTSAKESCIFTYTQAASVSVVPEYDVPSESDC